MVDRVSFLLLALRPAPLPPTVPAPTPLRPPAVPASRPPAPTPAPPAPASRSPTAAVTVPGTAASATGVPEMRAWLISNVFNYFYFSIIHSSIFRVFQSF